jgi:ferredoxin-like protein FixX
MYASIHADCRARLAWWSAAAGCKFADDLRLLEDLAEMRTYMCPAGLYEIPESRRTKGAVDQIVNYTNCMRCGRSRPWADG